MHPIRIAAYFDILSQSQKAYGKQLEPVCRKWDLTRSEVDVLLFLYNNPEYDRAADIVTRRGMTKSHVSMSVASLADRNLLQRSASAEDRRTVRLRLTEDGWNPKKLLLDFFHYTGKYDLLIYTGYTLLIPILMPIIPHYIGFIAVQITLFYMIPIPYVLGSLLSVLLFAIQYTICILLASRYWHKHRLHAISDKPNSP